MSKTRRVSRKPLASHKPLYILLGLSLFIVVTVVIYKTYFTPQSIEIMAIDPITYGETSIQGTIQSNMSPEEKGSFILLLRDTRIVKLDVKGLDHLVGQPVTVVGILSPTDSEYAPIDMQVQSITVGIN